MAECVSQRKLYKAATMGDTSALDQLLQQDPYLLDTLSYTCPNKTTPLHVATLKGHLHFVEAILKLNPQLAEEFDSQQRSPLHIAADKGYVDIAKLLLSAAPDMCWSRDCQHWNPVHVAAMKGHARLVAELVEAVPVAAMEKLDGGLNVLSLCVKHGRFEAFQILATRMNELINWKDDDGDTVLHLAVRTKQVEIIKYLVEKTGIDVNVSNSKGLTAMNILEQSPPDEDVKTLEIRKILKTGVFRTCYIQPQPVKWLTKKRDSIMVVAILIATMAFQAGVMPPGGVWQEDSKDFTYKAGEAIIAYRHPKAFKSFMRVNAIAFVASLSTILLLISGLPFRHKLFMWILMVIMWLTITSTAVTYTICIVVVTPKKDRKSLSHVIEIALAMWCSIMGILLLGNTLRLIDRWLKNKGIVVWRPKWFRDLNDVRNVNAVAAQESV